MLALEKGEPLDEVLFCEVMFDLERGISGEIPEHIEWVYNTAIPALENTGVSTRVLRGNTDYVSNFYRHSVACKSKGKRRGFPLGGMCVINRECKVGVIRKYLKTIPD